MFDDTLGLKRKHKSIKDRQHKGQMKTEQIMIYKIVDRKIKIEQGKPKNIKLVFVVLKLLGPFLIHDLSPGL